MDNFCSCFDDALLLNQHLIFQLIIQSEFAGHLYKIGQVVGANLPSISTHLLLQREI